MDVINKLEINDKINSISRGIEIKKKKKCGNTVLQQVIIIIIIYSDANGRCAVIMTTNTGQWW